MSDFAILFVDIVGFSKLKDADQAAVAGGLNLECKRYLSAALDIQNHTNIHRITAMPTGDGLMICIQRSSTIEDPGHFLIGLALKFQQWGHGKGDNPPPMNVSFRMGLHAGNPASFCDVNGLQNCCGDDINMAQRIMDCGDADHILCSDVAHRKLFGSARTREGYTFHQLEMPFIVKHNVNINLVSVTGAGQKPNPLPPRQSWRALFLQRALLGLQDFYDCEHLTIVGLTNDQIAKELPKELSSMSRLRKISVFYANPKFYDNIPDEVVVTRLSDVKGNEYRNREQLERERLNSVRAFTGMRKANLAIEFFDYTVFPIVAMVAGDTDNKDEACGIIRVTHYLWGQNAGSRPTLVIRRNDMPEVYDSYRSFLKNLRGTHSNAI